MSVVEHLEKDTPISFEIIPPVRGKCIDPVLAVVEKLAAYNPPFIDVTSHAAVEEVVHDEGNTHIIHRKRRVGTLALCSVIQNHYNIDAVAHVLCDGFTPQETEDFLLELHYAKVRNVLALKGDGSPKDKLNDRYASDLVSQINRLREGEYLNGQKGDELDFCVGVAAYPEKHFCAPNRQTDIEFLKKKQDAGADYAVTQLFFSAETYFDFVAAAREQGVTIPIIPGMKILSHKNQLTSVPSMFHVDIPYALSGAITADPEHAQEIGVEWAATESKKLLAGGAPGLHYYVMLNPDPTLKVVEHVRKSL